MTLTRQKIRDRSNSLVEKMLPRTIWTLWFQGWGDAPEIVNACYRTWQQHNPDWTIHRLIHTDVGEILADTPASRLIGTGLPYEALSDIVRIELLSRHGGVWADATTYCLRPLDDWLPSVTTTGFFAFDRPGPDRMISSWFLAASKSSAITARWREYVEKYWRDRSERDHYFWFHYLFRDAYDADDEFKRIWDLTPKITADGPHRFIPYVNKLTRPPTDEDVTFVENKHVPLLKLTHELGTMTPDEKSTYRWLIRRASGQLESTSQEL